MSSFSFPLRPLLPVKRARGVNPMRRFLPALSVVLLALALWAQDSEAQTPGAPAAPTNLSLTAEINQFEEHVISVSWTAPASPGSDPITEYRVEWRLSGSEDHWESRDTGNTNTAYRFGDFGILVNSKYEVRVSAFNSAGQGAFVTGTVETVNYQTPTISVTGSTLREDGSDSLIISIDPAPAGDISFDYQISKESGDTAIVGDTPPHWISTRLAAQLLVVTSMLNAQWLRCIRSSNGNP